MRKLAKSCVHAVFLVLAFIPAALSGFGRLKPVYTFFAHPEAHIGKNVYVGSYCILGRVTIGDGTLLASGVQVLSGQHQHTRSADGDAFSGGQFVQITIGADSWIGAAATVMANVGSRTTVGAGSVVTKPVPDDCVAAGNPARIIRGGESNTTSNES